MRALPVIERVMLVVIALLVLFLLVFMVAWHVRWRGMVSAAVALEPHPGVVVAAPVMMPADVNRDFRAWMGDCLNQKQNSWSFYGRDLTAECLIQVPLEAGEDISISGRAYSVNMPKDFYLDLALATRLRDLLARGLVLGAAGPLPEGRTRVEPAEAEAAEGVAGLGVVLGWTLRAAGRWRAAPLAGGDRGAALDALDALAAALGPRALAHGDLYAAILAQRDAAYLDAQEAGAIDPVRLARWRAEGAGDPLAALQVALEYDRRWTEPGEGLERFSAGPLHVMTSYDMSPDTWDNVPAALDLWWGEPQQTAFLCSQIAQSQDAIISNDLAWRPQHNVVDMIAAPLLANVVRQRFARLASIILEGWSQGRLPNLPGLDLGPGPTGHAAALTCSSPRPGEWDVALAPVQAGFLARDWGARSLWTPALVFASGSGHALRQPFFAWSGSALVVRFPLKASPTAPSP
jgi:hypothetical protein